MQRFIIIFLVQFLLQPMNGQTVPERLVEAIRKGDAARMSEWFHQSLEMTILENDYVASKTQATRIIENFFKSYPPTEFRISFEGTKEKSKYAIGSLKCAGNSFRINMFFIAKGNDRLIYYLSIEKESTYELNQ
jgi:hypothetical protein